MVGHPAGVEPGLLRRDRRAGKPLGVEPFAVVREDQAEVRSGHAPTLTATIPSVALLATPPSAPVVVSPAANEISFGRVIGPGGGRDDQGGRQRRRTRRGQQGRRQDAVRLRGPAPGAGCPAHDQSAVDERGRGASTTIGPVFSLPATAEPRGPPRQERRGSAAWPARSVRWRARSPASAASTCRTCAPAPAPPGTPARASRPRRPSRLRSRSRSSAGSAGSRRAAAGSTRCCARRSSRPTTGRPTTCSPGSAARRAAARPT